MKQSGDYRRIGIALAFVVICVMMSPATTSAWPTIDGRYFNTVDGPAIRNSSFIDGLDRWTVKSGSVSLSADVQYDYSDAISFYLGVNNDIIIEQELPDYADESNIIQFAHGKELIFSFKFKADYESTARASIGTKVRVDGALTWVWTSCNPLPGQVTGDGAGSWVLVQQTCAINKNTVFGLAVRIEIIDSYCPAASSSIDDVAVPQYVSYPEEPLPVYTGYVDDAQLAVGQTISTVANGVKASLVFIIRSVSYDSGIGRNHAVVDIAFASDTSEYKVNDVPSAIHCILIEIHPHPVKWIFSYISKQQGLVNVIHVGQSNDKGVDFKPCNDAATAIALQVAAWALSFFVGICIAPFTAGMSLGIAALAGIGLATSVVVDVGMKLLGESLSAFDTHAEGPKGYDYFTRTKFEPNVDDRITRMTITNRIDWYYAPGHPEYNLQIYGSVGYSVFPLTGGRLELVTYLYA